jgi:hypothetical protein
MDAGVGAALAFLGHEFYEAPTWHFMWILLGTLRKVIHI